jgi:hypothetical protein
MVSDRIKDQQVVLWRQFKNDVLFEKHVLKFTKLY